MLTLSIQVSSLFDETWQHIYIAHSTYVYETTSVRGKVAAMAASLCTQYSSEPKMAGFE